MLLSFFPTDPLQLIDEVFFHIAFLFLPLLSPIANVCIFIDVGYKGQQRSYQVSEKQLLSNT